MNECPFTPARLHELLHGPQPWTVEQIATLAQAALGADVSPAEVGAWLQAAGIEPRQPKRAATPAPPKAQRRGGGGKRYGGEPVHLLCDCGCDRRIVRPLSEVAESGRAFVNRAHHLKWRQEQARLRLVMNKSQAGRDLSQTKLCPTCDPPEVRPLSEFRVDKHKPGGRARICNDCNRRKCAEYYRSHQERLKAKAQERRGRERQT